MFSPKQGREEGDWYEALCLIFMILVLLENVKKCALGGCTITSELKSTLFEIFSHSTGPFGAAPFEKISNNVGFSL